MLVEHVDFKTLRQAIKAISLPRELGSWLIKIFVHFCISFAFSFWVLVKPQEDAFCVQALHVELSAPREGLPSCLKMKRTLNSVLQWNQFSLSTSLFEQVAFFRFVLCG